MENSQITTMLLAHANPLRAFAYRFTKNANDADDLYQDTILKAVRYFHKFNEGTNFKAWLFTIMRNTFINDYRRNTSRNKVVLVRETLEYSDLMGNCSKNSAEGNFIIRDVNKILNSIPELYAVPFIKYFEGYKYCEIAQALDIPIGTVKTRIHSARILLKKQLKPYKD
jgi:RNA polymerase sigma factor (sigma-70 family)